MTTVLAVHTSAGFEELVAEMLEIVAPVAAGAVILGYGTEHDLSTSKLE